MALALASSGDRRGAHMTSGHTDLMWASQYGHKAVVELLLEGNYGTTVLFLASMQGHETVVKLLLEAGADVNAGSDDGHTASKKAYREGHKALAKLLTEAEANSQI